MEFAITREPHGDNAGQNTEHQLQHRGDGEVDQRVAIAALAFIFPVAAEEAGRNLRDNAGDKDNEGVHHPLNQSHGDHIAIGDVADFMGDDRFRFITAHVLQQPGTDSDQRGVATRTGSEGVDVRGVIDSHLRHGNARLLRLLRNGVHQPAFRFVARLLDHFPTHRLQRHPFRHHQRNDRTTEAEQQGHNQQTGHAAGLDPREA